MIDGLLYAGLIFVYLFTFRLWAACKSLKDDLFHYSGSGFSLKIQEYTTGKIDTSTLSIRVFHNKIVVFSGEIFNAVIQFWSIPFMISLYSLAGVFFIVYELQYLFGKKKFKELLLILSLINALFLVEIFLGNKIPFILSIILLTGPYIGLFSAGYWTFIKRHKARKKYLLIFLLLLSLSWALLFRQSVAQYCILK